MHFRLCLFLILLLSAPLLLSQDTLKNKLSFQVGMTRMDFFSGFTYAKDIHKIQPFVSIEIGINRTIFQSRLFPKISIGCAYWLLKRNNFRFGPQLSYASSILKINLNSSHFNLWNELYAGLRIEVGSKVRFFTVLSGGWMNERYFNTFDQRYVGVNSLGFNPYIGLCYAW